MNDVSKAEGMRAAQEAKDRVVASPPSSSKTAVEAAMRRYLSAEQYHELTEDERRSADERERTDEEG